jgi:hypothetical protein
MQADDQIQAMEYAEKVGSNVCQNLAPSLAKKREPDTWLFELSQADF